MHEASLYEENCFITLTYGRDQLPKHGALCHRDFQLFMKRLRFHKLGGYVRFYMCGEYGPKNGRPHYHANLFNINFHDRQPAGKSGSGNIYYESPTLDALWGLGKTSVQDLTPRTAAYCTAYMLGQAEGANNKRQVLDQETGELIDLPPEYAKMSLKPGIGAGWYEKFSRDIYLHDRATMEGAKLSPPKYYDKLERRTNLPRAAANETNRLERAAKAGPDNTPERRLDRETVHKARLRANTRDTEL